MLNVSDEKVKYKKPKFGDISRSARKADHRHSYRPCVLHEQYKFTNVKTGQPEVLNWTFNSTYCTTCGKIGGGVGVTSNREERDNLIERMIEEGAPEFTIDSLWADKVNLNG